MVNTEKKSDNVIIRYLKVLGLLFLLAALGVAFYGWFNATNKIVEVEDELSTQVEDYKKLSAELEDALNDNNKIVDQNVELVSINKELISLNEKMAKSAETKFSTTFNKLKEVKVEIERVEAEKAKMAELSKQTKQVSVNSEKVVSKGVHAGTFRASAYGADCRGCSGITASGLTPKVGVTVAADPRVLPIGTKVYIEFPKAPAYNGTYTVQDTGGAIKGNKLDIFLGTERKSLSFGVQQAKVTIVK